MLSIITTTSIATLALLSPPTQSLSFTSSKSSLSSRWASSFTSSSSVRILSDGYADHAVAVVSPDVAVGREFGTSAFGTFWFAWSCSDDVWHRMLACFRVGTTRRCIRQPARPVHLFFEQRISEKVAITLTITNYTSSHHHSPHNIFHPTPLLSPFSSLPIHQTPHESLPLTQPLPLLQIIPTN